ncbi:MAG: hypothetical protein M3N98_03105 [Actinomycetota bacterium]|nr:hypothetical protein [Actinomycetota bacterium]
MTTRQVSYLRDRLLKKGTITAEGDHLNFAIPGLADYVLGQRAALGSASPDLIGDGSPPSAEKTSQIRWPRRSPKPPEAELGL